MKMQSKNIILNSIREFLDKLDDDISNIYEETYKNKVEINSITSLLIKKKVFIKEEIMEEITRVRKKIRDE